MKLNILSIPTADQLKLVQGVERDLLRRRRTGTISGITAIAWATIQILIGLVHEKYLENIGPFIENLISGQWRDLFGAPEGLSIYEVTGILVLVIAVGVYLVFRWTRVLLREAEEPFRYTFFIESFKKVGGTPGSRADLKKDDRFHLLHHDLMERLNQRIRRFSLLNEASLNLTPDALTSHIHISGDYAIREEKDGNWVIHVMPSVRIGPPSRPATLAYPVKFPLSDNKTQKIKDTNSTVVSHTPEDVFEHALGPDEYDRIVERVYSSIATEVYKQIKSDVKGKIALFPSHYLRAVALFHEAKDFERSNTIDSYDCAIELYSESKRYFDIANIKWISRCLMRIPLLWRLERRFLYMDARTRIGYSRCTIYRRVISALSGRYKNTLYGIRNEIERAIHCLEKLYKKFKKDRWKRLVSGEEIKNQKRLQKRLYTLMAFMTFPKDSTVRRSKPLFDKLRESLFNAHVVAALADYYLDAVEKAKDHLNDAKAAAPDLSVKNPLYLLAAAEIEADLNKEILLFQQATELAPDFEIAQYRLAYYSEMRFRAQNELTKARAESVIKEYDEVLRINPGNIASLAAQGYLWWLLEDLNKAKSLNKAKRKFKEGCDVKATVRQTFIGELNYGLARIAAEEGQFNMSYDLYTQAISADPGIGAYSVTAGERVTTSYYDYIGSAILKRYKLFKEKVVNEIQKKIKSLKRAKRRKMVDKEKKEVSLRTLYAVWSFVLNDYGNACLNYFLRFGDTEQLGNAIKAFEKAIKIDPDNAVAYYNVQNAYDWRGEPSDKISEAEKLAPAWPVVLIASAQSRLREQWKKLEKAKEEIEQAERTRPTELKKIENLLAKAREKGIPEVSQAEPEGTTTEKVKEYFKAQETVLKTVNKIVKRTKLSSMFEGFRFELNGEGVGKLLSESKEIERDRLDENDVQALRVWAEVLSNNYQIGKDGKVEKVKKALDAAEKLLEYILENYCPDNFDVNKILRDMYMREKHYYWLKLELKGEDRGRRIRRKIEKCNEKIRNYTETMKPTIKNWLDQDPIHYVALMWAANFFEGEERVEFFKRAIESGPEVAAYYYRLGCELRRLKVWKIATKALQKVIEKDQQNAIYQNMLGIIYYEESKKLNKSIEHWKRAIEKDPQVAVYHANLGDGFRKLGKWGEAENAYLEAINIEPDNPIYQNDLGNAFYSNKDYERAAEQYLKAIKINPEVKVYTPKLILACKQLEDLDKAISLLKSASKLIPDNFEITQVIERLKNRKKIN